MISPNTHACSNNRTRVHLIHISMIFKGHTEVICKPQPLVFFNFLPSNTQKFLNI